MSEVKRYDMSGYGDGMIEVPDGAFVHIDDHLSQLAALREELAQRDSFEELYNAAIDERDAIQQRLADAERRNAILIDALTEERRIRLLGQQPDIHWESLRDDRRACYAKTDAALTKPEEAKS